MTATALKNWSGNHVYRATEYHRPATLEELRSVLASASSLRILGSRHSFNANGDAAALVSLERLPGAHAITTDRTTMTATVGAAVTYAELGRVLHAQGLGLQNLASLPHISVVGAVATATHGSGDHIGNLATAVRGLTLITPEGAVVDIGACDSRLHGAAVHLGALGVVIAVRLALVEDYAVRQAVYEGLDWDVLLDNLDAVFAAGRSVSVFHDAGLRPHSVWVKSALVDGPLPATLLGARPATAPRHPLPGEDPGHTTEQLGIPGPWHERLPHFRSGFKPSAGAEIQSELFVDRADGVAAIRALLSIGREIRGLMFIGELRTIAADDLWLSPQHGRDTLALHFTWRREPAEVDAAVALIHRALVATGLRPRPHWGKVFMPNAEELADHYPRLAEFAALRRELDPRGVLVNDWLRTRLPGALV